MSQPISSSTGDSNAAYVAAHEAYEAAVEKCHTPEAQSAMKESAVVGSTLAEVLADKACQELQVAEQKAGFGYDKK